MKKSLVASLVLIIVLSACNREKEITRPGDYSVFMKEDLLYKQVKQINRELSFWDQRLRSDTGSYVNKMELASCYLRLFQTSGDISFLRTGDSLLKSSSTTLNNTDPDILFALSQTSITQHQFRNAGMYNKEAEKAQGSKYINRLLEFDAEMELGQYNVAAIKLESLKDKSTFDYLIRKSKLEDHRGDLDEAIVLMEQAFEKVKDKKPSLYCWSLSNLADMYGHAGRIKDSYNAYINVLKKDSSYIYALKGIAWIAYSHDNNTAEAKRILQHILSQTKMPDLWLTLAEIEEWGGDVTKKKEYINLFLKEVERPEYGAMYNKYLINIYTTEFPDLNKALLLAEKEVESRPTPETFNWLAWVHYNKGDSDKAYMLAKNHVYKQTFEPDAVLNTALIFAANGKKEEAKQMLEECLESSFEIGPVTTKQIKEKLASL